MLDKQFFNNDKFQNYLIDNFVVLHAKQGQKFGNKLYKKYDVRNKPTVIIANSDGTEINRIVGYDPPAEEFKNKIVQAYHEEEIFTKLHKAHEINPTDLNIMAFLLRNYLKRYNIEKVKEFSKKILDQTEEAKILTVPFGKERNEVPVFEFTQYALGYIDPNNTLDFINNFPESDFRETTFSYLARLLSYPEQQFKVVPIFEQLISAYPENPSIIFPYINFCARTGHNKVNALKLADRYFQSDSNVDLRFVLSFIELLIYKNQQSKIHQVQQKFLVDNPDEEAEFLLQLGCLYQNMKRYDEAFITFDSCINKYPEDFNSYYQYGRTAVASQTNLQKAEIYLKIYLNHEPEEGMPTLATSHWRLGKIYEMNGKKELAIKEYETAIGQNSDFEDAILSLKNIKDHN